MKGNILIIEDEEDLTNTLKQLLSKYADEIYVAYNGADGLRFINNKDIHCVICDIFMPEMTGLEVLKAVRENGNDVPFIFFSAYNAAEIKSEVAQYDKTIFLNKPEIAEMTRVVSSIL